MTWKLETEELIDRSMEIVGKITHTGKMFYKQQPLLQRISTGENLYGIYEEFYNSSWKVWCRNKYNTKMTIDKTDLKFIEEGGLNV